jgi:hypothetical protein
MHIDMFIMKNTIFAAQLHWELKISQSSNFTSTFLLKKEIDYATFVCFYAICLYSIPKNREFCDIWGFYHDNISCHGNNKFVPGSPRAD